ncbi:MAG: hypothetical protein ACXVBY_11720, partial [Isosphaeraceae bacterium]
MSHQEIQRARYSAGILIAIRIAGFLQGPSACDRGIRKNQNGRHSRHDRQTYSFCSTSEHDSRSFSMRV